jgi:hypothetical protein
MKERMRNKYSLRLLFANLLPVLALTGGCAAGTWGSLDMSSEVRSDFMAGNVLPVHRYYTTGPEGTPNAIIGIAEEFTLVTERWRERTMTAELLGNLVFQMATEYGSPEEGFTGSTIVDQNGERIGVWYSPVSTSTVKILGEKKVRVDPPVLLGLGGSSSSSSGR